MSLFGWFTDLFWDADDFAVTGGTDHSDAPFAADVFEINPATGLPMIDDTLGMDVAGNPYGFDLSDDDFPSSTASGFDDDWLSSSSSSFDSSFSDW